MAAVAAGASVKATNRTIWQLFPKLVQVSGKKAGGVKASYGIARAIRSLRPVFEAIDEERVKLAKDGAKLDKDGKPLFTEDKTGYDIVDKEKFAEDLQTLMEIEDEHDVYHVPFAYFGDDSELTPHDFDVLIQLGAVLEEDAETK